MALISYMHSCYNCKLILLYILLFQDLLEQLSVQDQREVDKLNDDIRRLHQDNKIAFSTRMNLEATKNKLENLLTNNLIR